MSSTAIARRGAPAQPALTVGETPHARGRAPRPWAAPLHRPAAKILVAGGLTLAGWLLTAALSGNTASAAETAGCPDAPAVSTVDQSTDDSPAKLFTHGRHHRGHHRETGAATCAQQPETGDEAAKQTDETPVAETPVTDTKTDETPVVEQQTAAKQTAESLQPASVQSTRETEEPATEEPAAKPTSSGGGLLGGLVGGVLNVVGGTLNTVTSTVGAVTTTLSHTVLAPLTQPPANNPDAPVVLPLDDILAPVLGTGSNSGGVTAIVPGLLGGTTTEVTTTTAVVTATVPGTAAAEVTPQQTTGRVVVVHLIERQHSLPATQEQPQPGDSGVHARNGGGGDSGPGLPGGTSAPSAPAPTAAPGHDGPGGARHPFAVHTDHATTTQLKLIGVSRDHEVDGAGREAALPTTSPD